jgi:hypothetical protein
MGKKKTEFAAILQADPANCAVAIRRTTDDFWFVELTIVSTGVTEELLTARGTVKSWRNLADAIYFVQTTCPGCEKVSVEVGPWKFVRQTEKITPQ